MSFVHLKKRTTRNYLEYTFVIKFFRIEKVKGAKKRFTCNNGILAHFRRDEIEREAGEME